MRIHDSIEKASATLSAFLLSGAGATYFTDTLSKTVGEVTNSPEARGASAVLIGIPLAINTVYITYQVYKYQKDEDEIDWL